MGKKKERIRYVDDGRSLADMSGVGTRRLPKREAKPGSSAKDKWHTYWDAVKMMFLPMLAFIGLLVVLYAIMYFLLTVMS